jgi:hypothetical protein
VFCSEINLTIYLTPIRRQVLRYAPDTDEFLVGISQVVGTIAARVQSEEPVPDAVRKQIEGIIHEEYKYKGINIPVKLEYKTIPQSL